jgi:hypothetical protein
MVSSVKYAREQGSKGDLPLATPQLCYFIASSKLYQLDVSGGDLSGKMEVISNSHLLTH